ncbi:putative 2-phosphosulfolactate phosphatase [Planctomycetales bacterium]|nr:putative 2-phosphosulfolactate phosphatase [Planctomycetales bacterium]
MQVDVYPLPSFVPAENISGSTAVVIDTLRATTALIYASAAGVRRIIPLLDIEEAKQLKQSGLNGTVLPKDIILGGERNGVKIDGFDLGNSPHSYIPENVAGKTLIFTTTNGTVAMDTVRSAKRILPAALVNAGAVVKKIAENKKNDDKIIIVCAGTCGKETEEDLLTAGSIVFRLCGLCQTGVNSNIQLNETAERVKELWRNTVLMQDGSISKTKLLEYLRQSTGGQNLRRIGLDADIEAAAQIDKFDIVPVPFMFRQ